MLEPRLSGKELASLTSGPFNQSGLWDSQGSSGLEPRTAGKVLKGPSFSFISWALVPSPQAVRLL